MPKQSETGVGTLTIPVPAPDLKRGYDGLMRRYDSARNALVRTLYAWLNLMLLLRFTWPALVVFFDAPLASVENTPPDWFVLRLGAPVVVLVAVARLWRASGVPGYVARPVRLVELRSSGQLGLQALAFIALLAIALALVLLASDATAALKVLLFGLVEAAAIQAVIAGYVKTTFETVGGLPARIFWISVMLFGVEFALRGGLAAAIQPDATTAFVAGAGLAGFVAGLALGTACTYLRDRTASLLPGIILQVLIVALAPAVVS